MSWSSQFLPFPFARYGGGQPSVFAFGRAGVIVVGAGGVTHSDAPLLLTFQTGDGGQSWQAQAPLMLDPGASVYHVQPVSFSSPQDGWAVLSAGLYRTRDGGGHWTLLTRTGLPAGLKIGALKFMAGGTGWLSSNAGLYRTADGGQHWTRLSPAP